jgi:hypothetical protein
LRILGRDLCCDEIEERLNISESHINLFFKQFLSNYAELLYEKYVHIPHGEELSAVMEVYRRMGFPGCVGSMDVTHVYWDKCPNHLRFLCKGKEGRPTVAFQVVAEHSKRIHHISKPFYGATNDITITYQDSYPRKLLSREIYGDIVFQTYTRTGEVTYWRGAYLIVDGGYPKCGMLIDPSIKRFDYDSVMWSEWLESIRKDVECVFAALKNRFRMLRNRIVYTDINVIYNAFRVAAIFHNRLLEYDGYDEFDWESCDPESEEPEEEIIRRQDDIAEGDLREFPFGEGEQAIPLTQGAIGSQENPIPFIAFSLTSTSRGLLHSSFHREHLLLLLC